MGNNILIVDDAAFMRMMVKDILTKGGYNVVGEAENGVVAVQKYAELKPDLVTLDITMPEMDGIQALKKIKEVDAGANVIMCSAMVQIKHWLPGFSVWSRMISAYLRALNWQNRQAWRLSFMQRSLHMQIQIQPCFI